MCGRESMACNLSGRHPRPCAEDLTTSNKIKVLADPRDKPEDDGSTVFARVANPVRVRTPQFGGQSPMISRLSSFSDRSGCTR